MVNDEKAFCEGTLPFLLFDCILIKNCILFQLENLVHSPEEVLRQSMFPRVHPPEDNKFSKW
jgi:hypothetical protein